MASNFPWDFSKSHKICSPPYELCSTCGGKGRPMGFVIEINNPNSRYSRYQVTRFPCDGGMVSWPIDRIGRTE